MTRKGKSAIIFGAVGVVVVIGIIFASLNGPSVGDMFQRLTGKGGSGGDDDSVSGGNTVPNLGYLTRYMSILSLGEEGTYNAYPKFGKPPYSIEWKFNDGVTLSGEEAKRSFNSTGRYTFYLTIIDGTGDKVTSTELFTNVVQEKPQGQEVANATSLTHHP